MARADPAASKKTLASRATATNFAINETNRAARERSRSLRPLSTGRVRSGPKSRVHRRAAGRISGGPAERGPIKSLVGASLTRAEAPRPIRSIIYKRTCRIASPPVADRLPPAALFAAARTQYLNEPNPLGAIFMRPGGGVRYLPSLRLVLRPSALEAPFFQRENFGARRESDEFSAPRRSHEFIQYRKTPPPPGAVFLACRFAVSGQLHADNNGTGGIKCMAVDNARSRAARSERKFSPSRFFALPGRRSVRRASVTETI